MRKSLAAALVVSSCLLLVVNLALIRENRRFREQAKTALEIAPGTQVPALASRTISGKPLNIEYGSGNPATLFLVMSSTCSVCEANWPRWTQLIRAIDARRFRIVGIDLQSNVTAPYLLRHEFLNAPVATDLDPKLLIAYNLMLTPQTLLVDGMGTVRGVWSGMLKPADIDAITQLSATLEEPSGSRP